MVLRWPTKLSSPSLRRTEQPEAIPVPGRTPDNNNNGSNNNNESLDDF